MTNTIYVQMAAYRDPQLIPTLLDMIKNAKAPENLHVGICWQHGDDEPIDILLDSGFTIAGANENPKVGNATVLDITHTTGAKLTVNDSHIHKTEGACWALNQIQPLYSKEK